MTRQRAANMSYSECSTYPPAQTECPGPLVAVVGASRPPCQDWMITQYTRYINYNVCRFCRADATLSGRLNALGRLSCGEGACRPGPQDSSHYIHFPFCMQNHQFICIKSKLWLMVRHCLQHIPWFPFREKTTNHDHNAPTPRPRSQTAETPKNKENWY